MSTAALLGRWGVRPGVGWADFALLSAWFLALQVLDLATTLVVLALGGGEGNPVMADAMAQNGDHALLGAKLVVALFVLVWLGAWTLAIRERARQAGSSWVPVAVLTGIALATLAYTAVVFHNLTNVEVLLQRATEQGARQG